jgi:hypothetical protein
MSNKMWYEDYQKELEAEQKGKTREQVREELQTIGARVDVDEEGQPVYRKPEYVFDPETAPKQGHLWVDRGLKLSCEGAGHANHQAWKRQR